MLGILVKFKVLTNCTCESTVFEVGGGGHIPYSALTELMLAILVILFYFVAFFHSPSLLLSCV